MSGSTYIVSESVILPVAIIEIVFTVAGGIFFGFLAKNSLLVFSSEDTKKKHEGSAMYGCLSPVHGFAVAYYVFYMMFAVTVMLTTSALHPGLNAESCTWNLIFGTMFFTAAKGSQYGFFITRLKFVFAETTLAVPDWTIKKLLGAVAFYFLSATIATALTAAKFFNSVPITTAGRFQVCAPAQRSFDPVLVILILCFIVSDTYIMVSVVYGFVSRLLKMASQNLEDDVHDLAFQSGGFCGTSLVFAYVMGVGSILYPHNLVNVLFPFLDLTVNLVLIYAAQYYVFKNPFLTHVMWNIEMMGGKMKVDATSPTSDDVHPSENFGDVSG